MSSFIDTERWWLRQTVAYHADPSPKLYLDRFANLQRPHVKRFKRVPTAYIDWYHRHHSHRRDVTQSEGNRFIRNDDL